MDTQKEIPAIVMSTIEGALLKLRVTGCAFKLMLPNDVVIEHEAERFNPKKVKGERRVRRPNGTFRDHYYPIVENLQPGQVGEIAYTDEQFAVDLQASVTAYMSKIWGNGSYVTSTNKTKKVLEILRLK